MNSAGQLFSLDFVLSMIVFLLVFAFLYQSYFSNVDRFKQHQIALEIQERVNAQADVLVNSPGFPIDWNESGVIVMGLALQPGVLDYSKVQKLASLTANDYNHARAVMNISAFEFRIDLDSNNDALDLNMGRDPTGYLEVSAAARIVTMEGESAVFRLSLFR